MFKEKIQPSLVLTLICLIACALLVAAYEATYVDNTGVITDKMITGLEDIYGTSEGFSMKLNEDGTVYAPEGVSSVLTDENGNTAFEITADGYSSGGLHVMVGMSPEGAVAGVSILAISETPGVGTRVQDEAFLGQFEGLTYEKLPADAVEDTAKKTYVWGSSEEIASLKEAAAAVPAGDTFKLDAVTGATLSSNGMNRAVTTALTAYNEMKGVSGNE